MGGDLPKEPSKGCEDFTLVAICAAPASPLQRTTSAWRNRSSANRGNEIQPDNLARYRRLITDSDRLPQLPPALSWALRFGPDFFFGEFIARKTETEELQCFHSYGEKCDGFLNDVFLSDGVDNPIVRFETDHPLFGPTFLNDFVVGTVLNSLGSMANSQAMPENDRVGTSDRVRQLCLDQNLIWDAPYAVGRVRAWLSGEELVVESTFETAVISRPTG